MSAPALSELRALYVHIPFCERKCEYCDFASIAGKRAEGAYTAALRADGHHAVGLAGGVRLWEPDLDEFFVGEPHAQWPPPSESSP